MPVFFGGYIKQAIGSRSPKVAEYAYFGKSVQGTELAHRLALQVSAKALCEVRRETRGTFVMDGRIATPVVLRAICVKLEPLGVGSLDGLAQFQIPDLIREIGQRIEGSMWRDHGCDRMVRLTKGLAAFEVMTPETALERICRGFKPYLKKEMLTRGLQGLAIAGLGAGVSFLTSMDDLSASGLIGYELENMVASGIEVLATLNLGRAAQCLIARTQHYPVIKKRVFLRYLERTVSGIAAAEIDPYEFEVKA